MRVLVTGAAGRIGSATCERLAREGFDVLGADLAFRKDGPVRTHVANLLDREACYRLLEDAEAVIHLANHPDMHGRDSQKILNENVAVNMNVFQAAAEIGVSKVVFASTIQVIAGKRRGSDSGAPEPSELAYLPLDGDAPANARNPYALSKLLTETMLAYFAREHEMSCTAIRFPLVIAREWFEHARERVQRRPGPWQLLDEGFAYLSAEDAADLMHRILLAELPGFRVYLPAAPTPSLPVPVPDLVREYYPDVPLRKPREELTGLVDSSRITGETGWVARDEIWPSEAQPTVRA